MVSQVFDVVYIVLTHILAVFYKLQMYSSAKVLALGCTHVD